MKRSVKLRPANTAGIIIPPNDEIKDAVSILILQNVPTLLHQKREHRWVWFNQWELAALLGLELLPEDLIQALVKKGYLESSGSKLRITDKTLKFYKAMRILAAKATV